MQALKAMVLEGQVATILPVSMLHQELRHGTVTASAITQHGVRRQLTLAQPSFRQSTQATDAVSRLIRAEIEHLRRQGMFSWNSLAGIPARGRRNAQLAGRANRVARRPERARAILPRSLHIGRFISSRHESHPAMILDGGCGFSDHGAIASGRTCPQPGAAA